jgi:hypothetical protein
MIFTDSGRHHTVFAKIKKDTPSNLPFPRTGEFLFPAFRLKRCCSFLFRWALGFGLWIILSLSSGCSIPTDVKPPKWDTKFSFPLSDYTYQFSKFIEDSRNIKDDLGNPMVFARGDTIRFSFQSDHPESMTVSQNLSIDPLIKETSRQEIGRIKFNLDSRDQAAFAFKEVYAKQGFKPSYVKAPIPAITFLDTTSLSIGVDSGFYRMLFTGGNSEGSINTINLSITNGLPIGFSRLAVSILSLKEFQDFTTGEIKPAGSFISGVYTENIPRSMLPGHPVKIALPLSDRTVPADLVIKVEGYTTPRGSAETVTQTISIPSGIDNHTGLVAYKDTTVIIPRDQSDWIAVDESVLDTQLVIAMEFTPMEADKVESRIPGQIVHQTNSFDMKNPDMTISSAIVAHGALNFDFASHLPVNADIVLRLPDFDQEYRLVIPAQVGNLASTGRRSVDFSGKRLVFNDLSNQKIAYSIDIITEEKDHVIISNQDYVEVKVSSELFAVSELIGYLNGKKYLTPMSQHLPLESLPKGLEGGIVFGSAPLVIGFEIDPGKSDMPLLAHLDITAVKNDGRTRTTSVDTTLTRGKYSILTEGRDLISIIPDSIRVSGYISMKTNELATFRPDSQFNVNGTVRNVSLIMDMPAVFRVNETTITLSDVKREEVDDQIRKRFTRGDVKNIFISGEVQNNNPLSGAARLLVSPDSLSFADSKNRGTSAPIDTLASFELPQPVFDRFGNIIRSGVGAIRIGIDTSKYHMFTNRYLYVKTEVSLKSTATGDNEEGWVSLGPNQFITIRTLLDCELFIDPSATNK